MRKILLIIAAVLTLCACNNDADNGRTPSFTCKERNIRTGRCTQAEFVCSGNLYGEPAELSYYKDGQVKCQPK